MPRHGTSFRYAGLLGAVVVLALSGCKASDPTAGSTPSGSSGAGAAASATGSAASPSATSNGPTSPAARTLPTNGKCVLIDRAKAAALLGGAAKGSAANIGKTGIKHVDGCTYVSAAGNLGYDVNNFGSGAAPTQFIAAAKKAAAGPIKVYPISGGDASYAFTLAVGSKVMARAEIAVGEYLVAINTVAPDAADAKRVTAAAAALLVAAVSG